MSLCSCPSCSPRENDAEFELMHEDRDALLRERDELLADMRELLENYTSQDYADCALINRMREKWGEK